MRVLVVGAGAVGSFLGALLASAGHHVTLVRLGEPAASGARLVLVRPDGSREELRVDRVPSVGAAVEGSWPGAAPGAAPGAGTVAPPDQGEGSRPELIVFAVKMPALESAVRTCAALPGVPALTVENGIGAEEAVASLRPGAGLVAASLTAAIELPSPGEVRWRSRGSLGLAVVEGPASDAAAIDDLVEQPVARLVERLVAAFSSAGLPAQRLPDAAAMKWSKLLANLPANATGAILDMDPAEVYRDPRLFALERRQMLEALAVMRRLGLRPVGWRGAPIPWLARAFRLPERLGRPILGRVVGGARGGKVPSLRGHVLAVAAGRAETPISEAAWLNGAVARHAAKLGYRAPVNACLARLVDEVAANPARREALLRRPERLLAEIAGGSALASADPILPGDADR